MRHTSRLSRWFTNRSFDLYRRFSRERRNASYDVAILGGGAMGSSTAYFLANRQPDLRICVIERDLTYSKCSTALSVGSIRQQFSTAENIQLSQFGFQFLSNIGEYLGVEGKDLPDINLKKGGYLILSGEKGLTTLQDNYTLQRDLGCAVSLLTQDELKTRFPWMNTDGIGMASLGTDKEGWFDPWALLDAFKKKSISLGVDYIHGEVTDIQLGKGNLVSNIEIVPNHLLQSRQNITCGVAVNTSGCWSGATASMLGIHLPIEPRKRFVFVIDCPDLVNEDVLLCDKSGFYFRPEGKHFVTGRCPPSVEEEPSIDNLDVDYDFFYEALWPDLAYRVPAFECLKVKSAWAGYYDYNTLDCNAVIGRHPEIKNLIFASGFSGHGIQHSPGTGRAVSELILDGNFTSINLSRLGYERVLNKDPLKENNIIG
ncbi:FAD-dependent oxidoreductase domain-containing protein 1-like [Actinia tenebrosa]|uniref:FAD-dependent oxidoreductase domain-containing protein 1 n=1 Tax=Actinia tenebrosa TaxID=6105 RepID=A0A6P8H5T5_ACTTE|nr:FAD-dependent oxidoreductase domain-containing protein 1-like [Actinia tenebrosa]